MPAVLVAVLADGDGAVRYDRGSRKLAPSVPYMIEERTVRNGDEACVFGKFSAADVAVVPDPDTWMLTPARLRKGPLESLSRGLALSAFGYMLGAAVWGALAAAWAFAFPVFGPTLW